MSNAAPELFSHGAGRRAAGHFWKIAKDGDPYLRATLDRHYSRRAYRDGRQVKLFVGPGEKIVMITEDAKAMWVWRKFIDASGQKGVNCAVFRNEGGFRSSDLIRDAEQIAWQRWPNERLYTFVNPKSIRSVNPGACYKAAGWKRCGVTKGGLVILEKIK